MVSKQAIKWAIKVCAEHNVQFEYTTKGNTHWQGYAISSEGKIKVSTHNLKNWQFKSVVLHEIAHCLNYRNKKYLIYHSKNNKLRTRKYLKKMALRAEVYTETVAMKLAKHYGLKKYFRSYYFNKYWRNYMKRLYGR